MHTVYLALGSNVGDRSLNLKNAFKSLSKKAHILKYGFHYESKAVGFENQNNFFNTVILVETKLTPLELLAFIKEVEKNVGRVPRFHWGPREIDIDILFCDQ